MRRENWLELEKYMLLCMKDCAHDMQHVRRVLKNALEIAKGESGVNMDVLMASALLHDIGRADEMDDPTADHAVTGAERACQLLQSMDFPDRFAEHVRQCIRTHRFRRSDPPASIEAKILFDADKLDVCGAIGIARTLMYSGEHHRPLYSTDAEGHVLDGLDTREDSFCREYRFKLEGMYNRFLTRRGAELAAERQQAACSFYHALLCEVSSTDGLNCIDGFLSE